MGARGPGEIFPDVPCHECHGARLKPEALCVKIGGKNIGNRRVSVRKAGEWFTEIPKQLNAQQNEIGVRVLKEIRERLKFLVDVASITSRWPAPPARCPAARASASGSPRRSAPASPAFYVLDEPSIGLHQRDNARLLETLKRLRDLGNTVIVVEHDEDAIRTADTCSTSAPAPASTAATSSPKAMSTTHRRAALMDWKISNRRTQRAGARTQAALAPRAENRQRPRQQPQEHRRQDPLGLFTCVTGVTGGGKSTFS